MKNSAPIPRRPLLLVGHSLGAGLALAASKVEPNIAGVIAISPAAEEVDRQNPKNLLILLGEYDLPSVRRGAVFIFEQSTGISLSTLTGPGTWSDPGMSRRLVILPWGEHSSGIFRFDSLNEMFKWLNFLYPRQLSNQLESSHLLVRFLFCGGLLWLFVPGANLVSDALQFLSCPVPKPNTVVTEKAAHKQMAPSRRSLNVSLGRLLDGSFERLTLAVYGIAGSLAVLVLLKWNPWNGLHLMSGGYLSGFLCLTGLAGLALRRPPLSLLRTSRSSLVFVLVALVFFLCLLAPAFSRNFLHLTLSGQRFWRVPWIASSVFPFYFFDEWVSRHLEQPKDRRRLLLFHASTRLSLALVLLLGFFVLQNSEVLIVLILPGLFTLSMVGWCLSGCVYTRTRSVAAAALFASLLTGWFFSVFFPQI